MKLLDRAKRLRHPDAGRLLDDLEHDWEPRHLAALHGLPLAQVRGIESFYDLVPTPSIPLTCVGTACFQRGSALQGKTATVHCLGRCYEAPASSDTDAGDIPCGSLVPEPIVLRSVLGDPSTDPMADYDLPGGQSILARVDQSGLRGRGGAAYPTGSKWRVARETPASDRVVVANGDEGDPGSYVDRLLMEEAPHAVLAGMFACAKAIGAGIGIVYVRGEYPDAARSMRAAIDEARAADVFGDHFDVRVVTGAGSYVAGEETALLRSIEGLRAEPSPKPPYPAERGLWGLPTIVQNVETLSVIPWVVQTGRAPHTKALCVSGAVRRPGVVEVALGTAVADVLERAAGGPSEGSRWKFALVGGPMGRVLPASAFDTPLSFETLPGMGHAGIVVFDHSVSVREFAEHLFAFARDESCGSCAPCRLGTAQLARCRDRESLKRVLDTLEMGSMCGFGTGVPRPIRDLLHAFSGEVLL